MVESIARHLCKQPFLPPRLTGTWGQPYLWRRRKLDKPWRSAMAKTLLFLGTSQALPRLLCSSVQAWAAIRGQRSGCAGDMADLLVSLDLWSHPEHSSDPPVPSSQPSAALLLLLLTHALGHLPALSHLLTSSLLFSSFVPTTPHCVTAALLPGGHSQSSLPRRYPFLACWSLNTRTPECPGSS